MPEHWAVTWPNIFPVRPKEQRAKSPAANMPSGDFYFCSHPKRGHLKKGKYVRYSLLPGQGFAVNALRTGGIAVFSILRLWWKLWGLGWGSGGNWRASQRPPKSSYRL